MKMTPPRPRNWRTSVASGAAAGNVRNRRVRVSGHRAGLTVTELLAVMMLLTIMMTFALPRLNLRGMRIDAAVREANITLMSAQRLAIQKQHNIVVAFDTAVNLIRIHEDADNDGVVDAGELVRQRPLGDGVRFGLGGAPARSIGGEAVTFKRTQTGLPAVTFSRAGTASEIGGFYLSSANSGVTAASVDTRAFEVERATGRTGRFRWDPGSNQWNRAF